MARIKDEKVCGQHHVPRSHCPPSGMHPRSARHRDDDWAALEDAAQDRNEDASAMIRLAAQVMAGYVRCWKCSEDAPPVPLMCGDLTGRTLAEAMAEAENRTAKQHPRHEAAWLGAEPGQVRAGKPPSAPAVFMEPKAART